MAMEEERLLRSLLILFIVVLLTACGRSGLPAAEPSPARTATQTPLAPNSPSPTLMATDTPIPILDVAIDQLAIGPQGQIYAGGYGNGAQQLPQSQIAQWDGETWVALDAGFQPQMEALVVDHAGQLYAEFFTDSQQGLTNAIMRWDGARWEDISGNFGTVVDVLKAGRLSSNIPVVALAVDGEDHLYAAGAFFYPGPGFTAEFPMGYVAKWDQDTWTVLGKGFDQVNILALAVSPTGEVYVASEQPRTPAGTSSYIAQWDGETWTQIDTSRLNTSGDLALDRSGNLYVGSIMSEPGGSIEYWDGTDWRTIPTRLGGEAPAILDMAVDANGHLYIAGSFETVNGIPARYIACWDGSSWQALGDGFNRQVNALAFDPGGDLYAAGFFTEAGELPVQQVARWDGERWHALEP
jgi:hypothetical protein